MPRAAPRSRWRRPRGRRRRGVIFASSLMPARLRSAVGSRPRLLRWTPSSVPPAAMTAPGCRARNATASSSRVGRKKTLRPVSIRIESSSARGQLVVHRTRGVKARQSPYLRGVDRQAGLQDRHIARAPAEVAGEARRGVASSSIRSSHSKSPVSDDDKPRRAEPALRPVVLDHRLLDRAQAPRRGVRPSIVTMCVPSSW